MTKDEKNQIVGEMKSVLSNANVVMKADLFANYRATPMALNQALWKAREELTAEGVVFRARAGSLVRAGWEGIERQATNQARAGQKKRTRAERKLRLAAELAPEKDAERLREMADRELLKGALASRRYKIG